MVTPTIDIRRYLFILKRRWVLSASVFLVIMGMGVAYCLFWPPVYQATCLVVVQPQKVPGDIVKPTVTTKLEDRLQIITQQVLSRTRLMEIIKRFDLYPELRGKLPPDELAEVMRKNITIKITRQNYFTITFVYPDPQKVAAVTNAIAAFYVDTNLRLREQDAVGTARFLGRELTRLKNQLAEWEAKILAFKEKHLHELPEARPENIKLINQLRQELQHLDNYLVAVRRRILGYESEMRRVQEFIEQMKQRKAEFVARGGAGGASSEFEAAANPEMIRRKLEELRVKYTDEHPDVKRLKKLLARALAMRKKRLAELAKQAKKKGVNPEDLKKAELERQIEQSRITLKKIQARIAQANEEIKQILAKRKATLEQIKIINKRIENAPAVEEKLKQLTRGYDELARAYEKLHSKWLEATMSANLERTQRGEQFEVVDAAQVPEEPYRPNVRRAIPLAFALALMAGIGVAFGLSYIETSFISVAQLEEMAGLPVLVVLPFLATEEEKSRKKLRTAILVGIFALLFLAVMGMVVLLMAGYGPQIKQAIKSLLGR